MASAQSPEIAPSTENIPGSSAGSKTPETPTRCRSPGSPIGDDACPICLGSFTDKCAAGSCLHNFCLVCLKEWSKQRPVCPLCKQSFTKILYDIKSETDYKEWEVPVLYPNDLNVIGRSVELGFRQYFDLAERTFFSYRSTLSRQARLRHNEAFITPSVGTIPSVSRRRQLHMQHQAMYADRGSSLFRLTVYTNNIWIQPLADITGRYRESNPHLYREQPALTHRLVPWVNRELAALISSSRIGVVLSDIMDLIERYPINSREFRRALRPHLGSWTSHFVHEFYNFARSPYDMVGHDNAAQYIPRYDDNDSEHEDSDNAEDEIIEIESDGVVVEPEPLDLTSGVVAREETIGNDGSVFISSDSDISVNEAYSNGTGISSRSNGNNLNTRSRSSSLSTKSRSSNMSTSLSMSNESRSQTLSNLDEPGPSGISSNGSINVKRETNHLDNSDSDECLIVDELKPKCERTPELINLSSNSETEENNRATNETHWKKKMSKQLEKKNNSKSSKGKKKPRIDRTSFSLHFSGTLNCQHGDDHTYCTESASPGNPGSTITESEEDGSSRQYSLESRSRNKTAKKRCIIYSHSDSDYDIEEEERKNYSRNYYKSSRRRSSRSRSISPSRKIKKDNKGKIKSSSKAVAAHKSLRETKPSTTSRKRSLSSNSDRYNLKKYSGSKKLKRYSRSSSSSSTSSSSYDSSTSSSSSDSSSSISSHSSSDDSSDSQDITSSSSDSISTSSSSSNDTSDSDSEYMPKSVPSIFKKRKRDMYKKSSSNKQTKVKKSIPKNHTSKKSTKRNKKCKKSI